ncbi:MAG: hypothetical protein V4496_05475 [Pseudomonadota bacterium]
MHPSLLVQNPPNEDLSPVDGIELVNLNKTDLAPNENNTPYTRERAFLGWSKKLDSTASTSHASLLGRSGLHPALLELPLDPLRIIWSFLNTKNLPLCECLILEAIFKNYKIASPEDRLQQPEALRLQTIKQWKLTRSKTIVDLTIAAPTQLEKQEKEKLFSTMEEVTKHLAHSIHKTAEEISDEHEASLKIIMRFTTDKSKEEIVNYLLSQLFGCYFLCWQHYNSKDNTDNDIEKYYKRLAEGINRLNFIKKNCAPWIKTPAASDEVKDEYEKTITNANIYFFTDCVPPHPLEKKAKCSF